MGEIAYVFFIILLMQTLIALFRENDASHDHAVQPWKSIAKKDNISLCLILPFMNVHSDKHENWNGKG